MKITGFELRIVEIPMKMAVRHALAERSVARNVFVAAHGDSGSTGWGECCPRPYVTGETVESVIEDLSATVLPALLGQSFADLNDAVALLTPLLDRMARNQQAAFCAAELAVLDLVGREFGVSAGEVIGPVSRPRVYYSGVIATDQPEAVQQQAGFMKKFGVRDVKVKVGPSLDTNLQVLKTARQILGEEVTLRIDANCAWSVDQAIEQLTAMRDYRLTGVEQPVPGENLEAMQQVTAARLVPVVADESLCSLADAVVLGERRGCDVFNVRISKCGGLINATRIQRQAQKMGIACQLGAQVGETGILSAAGRHFATRAGEVRWCEGSYDQMLLEEVITEPDVTVGPAGAAPAIDSPGLGVAPISGLLDSRTAKRMTLGEQ